MKRTLVCIMTITALLLTAFSLQAQTFEVPENPDISTKEGLQSLEKDIIAAAQWLEKTPIGTETSKRKQATAFVIAWLTNTPNVTLTARASILKLFDKNEDLLGVFMAGYARYCLENNFSKDELKASVAGIKAVMNCYNLGGKVKKDKNLIKVIKADKEGGLEEFIRKKME